MTRLKRAQKNTEFDSKNISEYCERQTTDVVFNIV